MYPSFPISTFLLAVCMDSSYKTAMGRPYSDLVLPTTKYEKVLDISTLSYKKIKFVSCFVHIRKIIFPQRRQDE